MHRTLVIIIIKANGSQFSKNQRYKGQTHQNNESNNPRKGYTQNLGP